MKLEQHKISPEMQIFFDRLLNLKDFVEESLSETDSVVLRKIFEELDDLIKDQR